MDFGFTLKPEHSIERHLALTRRAEANDFTYGWLFDSHVLWREVYTLLALMGTATWRMRLGTCVTNPATREPTVTASALATLQEVTRGRMDLGIGRGDSARRVLGKAPTSMAMLEESALVIRDLVEGRGTEYEGAWLELTWASREYRLPLWIAGYGPRALELAGRIADGIMLQIADPDLIAWMVGQVRAAALRAGRDPAAVRVMSAAPAHVARTDIARERVRWFPALVSNHVVDLVNRYDPAELPESLTAYVREREGYDYRHHAEVGSSNATFVSDEIADRFSLIGGVDDHVAKLLRLADAGVDQFNLYLMNGDEEEQLDIYGRDVIPAFREALARR
jgi:probable F420-dependent oxidoreductase